MSPLVFLNDQSLIHPTVFVASNASIIGRVEIGKDSSIWYNAVVRGDINLIRIGERTNVQDGTILHVTHDLPVVIGDDVTIGHRAVVHGCTVGNGSLIGMGAIVLDAASVGPHALVAAGAVVLEGFTVPEGVLAAGIPARIVRDLTTEERTHILSSAQNYVGYAKQLRSSVSMAGDTL